MADDRETYPYFIPMIWQYSPNTSPHVNVRGSLYNVTGVPQTQWNGTRRNVGFSNIATYITSYGMFVDVHSPIEISLDIEVDGSDALVTATINHISEMSDMSNTRVIFIVVYDNTSTMSGDYFASVVYYADMEFLTSQTTYNHTIPIDPGWDFNYTTVICLVQNLSGNTEIYNACRKRLFDNFPPVELTAVVNENRVSLSWTSPNTHDTILGYNIYRDSQKLNIHPLIGTTFSDFDVVADVEYIYHVTTVYEAQESERIDGIRITIPTIADKRFVQLGAGDLSTTSVEPSPLNVSYRSIRNQMIYTSRELALGGLPNDATITHIGFYVVEPPDQELLSFRIRMRHVSASQPLAHTSAPWTINDNLGNQTLTETGWEMFELTTPFAWNGGGNILLDTAFNLVAEATESGRIRIVNSQNGYRYSRNNTSSQTETTTIFLADYKPQLMLYYTTATNVTLVAPTSLEATPTVDGILLSWSGENHASEPSFVSYRIYRDGLVLNTNLVSIANFVDITAIYGENYTYTVTAIYTSGESEHSNEVNIDFVSDSDVVISPVSVKLLGNYPNPFNPDTTIAFSVGAMSSSPVRVQVAVYNIRGQKIRQLVDDSFSYGTHTIFWNGTSDTGLSVASGLYLYKVQSEGVSAVGKMVLIK
jgi:hypothetical protein